MEPEAKAVAAGVFARMRALREEMGLTQVECAAVAGWDQRRWSDVEGGRYPGLSVVSLTEIARALGIDTWDELMPPLSEQTNPPSEPEAASAPATKKKRPPKKKGGA